MWYLYTGDKEQHLIKTEYGQRPSGYMHGEGGTCTSGSAPYKTRQELFEHMKILPEVCRECGFYVVTHYAPEASQPLIHHNICYSCNFWREKHLLLTNTTLKRFFIVNGGWYSVSPDLPSNYSGFKGFGGHQFVFQRIDSGEITISKNAWFGGHVPEHYASRIPDNAVILTPAQYELLLTQKQQS
jgi:hypothetical protein